MLLGWDKLLILSPVATSSGDGPGGTSERSALHQSDATYLRWRPLTQLAGLGGGFASPAASADGS
jgi:hypothetical protein